MIKVYLVKHFGYNEHVYASKEDAIKVSNELGDAARVEEFIVQPETLVTLREE